MVPMALEVAWNTQAGNFSYAKFIMTEIRYDCPVNSCEGD